MKSNHNRLEQCSTSSLAAVRATLGREFSNLTEQQPRFVQLALNEAEALAWQTGYPELVFPTLAAEKVRRVAAWHERQQSIRQIEPALAFAE